MNALSTPRLILALTLTGTLGACSVLEEGKVDYKSAKPASTLEVPPDLTQLNKDSRYVLQSTSATASGFMSAAAQVKDAGTAANSMGDVNMQRNGQQRYLFVQRPADKVWEPLRKFWTDNGFVLTTDSPDIGIMETDWAENRAKLPQDFIRKTLGKVLDSLYSTGERDRFRTRVERTAKGVEIYVTHRRMVEEYADQQKERTIWMPGANDPELEIEFLRRLMVQLGATPEQAKAATTAGSAVAAPTSAQVSVQNGQPAIALSDDLERTWRRVGVALDRTGFTVEDRDRQKGIYFVRYVSGTGQEQPGFFARMFGAKKSEGPVLNKYRIAVSAQGTGSLVQVLNEQGQPESADNASKILKLLAPEIR